MASNTVNIGCGYTVSESVLTDDDTTLYRWAFTLCVQPWKKFFRNTLDPYGNTKPVEVKYADLSDDEQKELLNREIDYAKDELDLEPHYVFEKTQAGNVHAHGWFFSSQGDAHKYQVRLRVKLGYANNPLQRLCYLSRSSIDAETVGWKNYLLKETPDGKYGGLTLQQLNTNLFLK